MNKKIICASFIIPLFISTPLAAQQSSNEFHINTVYPGNTVNPDEIRKITIDIKEHSIGNDKDFGGLDQKTVEADPYNITTFILYANRHKNSDVASWFYKRAVPNMHNTKKPGKLNFAFKADITLTLDRNYSNKVKVTDYVIGQGHNQLSHNDWWYGSNACKYHLLNNWDPHRGQSAKDAVDSLICPSDMLGVKVLFQQGSSQATNKTTTVGLLRETMCPADLSKVSLGVVDKKPMCTFDLTTTTNTATDTQKNSHNFYAYNYDAKTIEDCLALKKDYSFVRASSSSSDSSKSVACTYSNESSEVSFTLLDSDWTAAPSSLAAWSNTTENATCNPQDSGKTGPQYCPFSGFVFSPFDYG